MSNTTNEKIRALVLAGLMIFSVFAGTTAIAGTAVANAPGAGNQPADNSDFDETSNVNVNTLPGDETSVANLNFSDDPGNVTDVYVNAAFGADSANLSADDIDTVTVTLIDGQGAESRNQTSYDNHGFNVSFDQTNNVEEVQVTVTPEGSDVIDGNETIDAGIEIFNGTTAGFGGTSPYDTKGSQSLSVNTGFITGTVEDTNGDPVQLDADEIEIRNEDTGTTVSGVDISTNAEGEIEPSRIELAPGNNYTIVVDAFQFQTFSATRFVASGSTETIEVTLERNIQPDTLRVETFDGNATGESSATLFANNQSSQTRQFVAILENSQIDSGAEDISASDFTGETIELTFNESTIGDFINNDQINESRTLDDLQVGDIDGDGIGETFATFEVTADNASEDTFPNNTALVTEQINASALGGELENDTASVNYVLEGEESISGQVTDQSGSPIENATVYAAIDGVSNESLAFAQETFVNDQGEAFLVDTTNENGQYAIPGIAGDNQGVTLYVIADGFNRINLTDTSVDRFVAADDAEQTAGPGAENEVHNFVLTDVEVILDFRVTVTAQDSETGEFTDPASVPIQDSTPVQIEVDVKTQNSPDSDFESIEDSSLVDSVDVNLSQTNEVVGNIQDSVTVSESGTNVSFEAVTAGLTDVTATVTNTEDEEFSDDVTIEAFGVGQIAGNIINDENPADNLPNANVTLFEVTESGLEQLDRTTSGPEGSYSFTEVRTGNEYRVVAEFNGNDGFAQVIKTEGGTTNADVVVGGADPDPANFTVSGLDPSDATVNNSQTFTVSATVENDGDVESTQAVQLLVSGSEIDSQQVTLSGGDSQSVEFTVDASDLAPGNYTHEIATEDDSVTGSLEVQETNSDNEPLPTLPGEDSPVTDTDGDGLYDDLNGDGTFDIRDVSVFLDHYQSDEVQNNTDLFDFTGDGAVDIRDVAALLDQTV